MSFQEFVDRAAPAGEAARRFDNSALELPDYPAPTPKQKAELAAKAREIAVEIGGKFDAEQAEHNARIGEILAQMNAYWQAPTPWGALPTPPPVALFQQWFAALLDLRAMCGRYEVDGERLARAGVPQFKTYLRLFIDDAEKAIETLKKTNTSILSSSPANYGAPPGSTPSFGVAPPPSPMAPPWLGQIPPGMMPPPMFQDPSMAFMNPGMNPGFFGFPPMPMPTGSVGSAGQAPAGASGTIPAPQIDNGWRDEFEANRKRMEEEGARRDAEHARFIKQIQS